MTAAATPPPPASTPAPVKRQRPRYSFSPHSSSPRSPPRTLSPLVRRIPSMLGKDEEFVTDTERSFREATPRSKRLRRTSDMWSYSAAAAKVEPGITATTPMELIPPSQDAMDSSILVAEQDESVSEMDGVVMHGSASPPGEENSDDEALMESMRTEHGFTRQEAELFLRIRKRGHEPLMPAHWQVDFGTMPDSLFFPAEENVVGYIDSISLAGTFGATSAFQALVTLGSTVRGRQEARIDPEDRVLQALRKYIQWSVDDVRTNMAGGTEIYPRLVVVGSGGKGSVHCEKRMQRKITELAADVRTEGEYLIGKGYSRPEPLSSTVYGLAVAGCVVALVTMDVSNVSADVKTHAILDFSDTTVDFWNAVAIALLVIAARDDELERNQFYDSNNLKKRPDPEPPTPSKRGWEAQRRLTQSLDEDA